MGKYDLLILAMLAIAGIWGISYIGGKKDGKGHPKAGGKR